MARKNFFFVFFHSLIVFAIILLLSTPEKVDLGFQKVCFYLYIISLFLYFYLVKGSGNLLCFNNIFIFGYSIVFFQVVVLQHFGYYMPAPAYNKYWDDSKIENLAVIVSVIALMFYMIGNIYSQLRVRGDVNSKEETYSIFFLVVVAYVSYILFFLTSGSYRSGVYYATDTLAGNAYFFKLFNVSLTAAIVVKLTFIYNNYKHLTLLKYISSFGLPLLLLSGWHILFSLYVGDRGVIISYLLLFSSLYFYKFKKISLVELVSVLVCASILMTAIGQVRKSKDYVTQLETVISGDSGNSRWYNESVPGSGFIELAHSGRTLNHALNEVPSEYDYRYGIYALKRIAGIFPGAQGVLNKVIDDNDNKYLATSGFISYLIQGDNPQYSDGTSITADIYLDFGVAGVFILMMLFGYFIGKTESNLLMPSLSTISITWVAFLIYYSKSLYLSRSSIFLELSNVILVLFFLYINKCFLKYFKS